MAEAHGALGRKGIVDEHLEIERKFLLAHEPPCLKEGAPSHLAQGYLAIGDADQARLRDEDGSLTLTVKAGRGMKRAEYEVEVSREQFDALWPATEGRRLEKQRHECPIGVGECVVDVYLGPLRGLRVVEVEFATSVQADSFEPPSWFGKEVTEVSGYGNVSLALNGLPRTEDLPE